MGKRRRRDGDTKADSAIVLEVEVEGEKKKRKGTRGGMEKGRRRRASKSVEGEKEKRSKRGRDHEGGGGGRRPSRQGTRTDSVRAAGASSPLPQQPWVGRPLSKLQLAMKKKLEGGEFRQLNEVMYTVTGADALEMMQRDPSLFDLYHRGYAEQVKRWPRNPLDDVIEYLRKQPSELRVADLGCGEARLSASVPQNTVHSFDLVAPNDRVVACDISRTPLPPHSVDVAVFCLSLMGTNYADYLREASRLLTPDGGGQLIIAEVTSRLLPNPTVFAQAIESLGFQLRKERKLGDFFVIMHFRRVVLKGKGRSRAAQVSMPPLKASVYKKR